ncbi:hypothetical protein EDC94DRAFT_617582 [Helicostylum pulchrum]|nr:hypothetical protein EDC94DRAFT_617582 [Helicostylum pulchrum]
MEINIHTLPIHATPKLTSILIKRSGTTPSALSQSKKYNVNPKRTRAYSNATLSNMTINSEDLTAKEFANIAGIRILPEQPDGEQEHELEEQEQEDGEEEGGRKFSTEDLVMHTISSNYTTSSYFQDNSLTCSLQTTNELKIWDNQFWFHPEETACRKDTTLTSTISSNSTSTRTSILDRKLSIKSASEPPILHELRRMGTRNSEKDACIIKKGRFEIQLNSSVSTPTITTTATTDKTSLDRTIKWKRKEKNPL